MERKRILFATTNPSKILRIKRLVQDMDIELLTLSDLPYQIEEPEEVGSDILEIAKNKAAYYRSKLQEDMPVLAEDSTLDFLGSVTPEDDPGNHVKAPVIKAFGEFSIANTIAYYSKLAEKYGGEIDFAFRYGLGYADAHGVKEARAELLAKLVRTPKGVEQMSGYPLRALTKLNIGGAYKYSVDISEEEHVQADQSLRDALHKLIQH